MRWAKLATIFVFVLFVHQAFAQQRPGHGTPQRALFDQGIQALRDQDFGTALERFKASYALQATSGALEGMATAYYRIGQLGSAYDMYLELALKYPTSMSTEATTRLADLRSNTGLLALDIVGGGGLVTVDDQQVGSSPLRTTIRVRTGEHKVRAARSGAAPVETVAKVTNDATFVAHLDLTTAQEATAQPATKDTQDTHGADKDKTVAVEGAPAIPASKESWDIPHGSLKYQAARTDKPIKVDGVLDEPIWQTARKEERFFSTRSKPFGTPTKEPTIVQLAYDERSLYVAFRCTYSEVRPRDDSFPADEVDVIAASEHVGILIDGQHDHTSAYAFYVARTGARADVEFTQGGEVPNPDWRGIWESAVERKPDEWTAEFRIPWSTAAVSSHDDDFVIGFNARRREPIVGEIAMVALHPPATAFINPNFFAHLAVKGPVRARETIFVQPYAAVAFDQAPARSGFQSRFYDFTDTGRDRFRLYAGLQVRYRPVRALQIDGTFNPDFTSVTPDLAATNLDRFELVFDENRPFFAENRARYEIGVAPCADEGCGDEPQLFYSRRIGLTTGLTGVTRFAPVIYGSRVIYRGEVDVAALNVGLSSSNPGISMADNISVIRINKSFGEGRRVGTIAIVRGGDAPGYLATGIDAAYTLFDQHLTVSGWMAESATNKSGRGIGVAGKAQVAWTSQDYFARASFTEIDSAFDGQLGYFPLIGARSGVFAAGYTPFLDNDLVRQVQLVGVFDRTRTQADQPIFERGLLLATATMTNNAYVTARLRPSLEWVSDPFSLGAIRVDPGRYPVTVGEIEASTAPRRKVEVAMGYGEGDLFAGYRRSPWTSIGLNLGRLVTKALYRLTFIRYGTSEAFDHQVSARATYSFSPLARITLAVEGNTLTRRATAQIAASIGFGALSTLSLVLRETSGIDLSNPTPGVRWTDNPNFIAVLSFAYGFTAL